MPRKITPLADKHMPQVHDLRQRGTAWHQVWLTLNQEHGIEASLDVLIDMYGRFLERQQDTMSRAALIQREAMACDALQGALWPMAMAGDVQAASTALRVIQHRSKLLGLEDKTPDQAAVAAQVLVVGSDSAEWLAALRAGRESIPLEEARKAIESNAEGRAGAEGG